MAATHPLRTYDHRLVQLVQDSGDASIATRLGVPRSTVAGWLKRGRRAVTTAQISEAFADELRHRIARLERRVARLAAILRILIAVVRVISPDFTRMRVLAADKATLLRAIERARRALPLRRILRIVGLSSSRLHAWRVAARACELSDHSSCPNSSPHRLTQPEISEIRDMVTSTAFRHVPIGRLAVLAQRIGKVVASASTWSRLVRERGWRRPRLRLHPQKPQLGIRASTPNEIWHIDTTVIRLLDGTRAYLHAVIDNFSRRILAWTLLDRFEPASTVEVLVRAGRTANGLLSPPTVLADAGVENRNRHVDELIDSGLLRRVLAMAEIRFSNSLIEAWWRALKHRWL